MITLSIVLVFVGIVLFKINHQVYHFFEISIKTLSILFIIMGFVILLISPLIRYSVKEDYVKYESLKSTVEILRENNNKLENATLSNKIIEINQITELYKFQNEHFLLDEWIPDEYVNKMETIE